MSGRIEAQADPRQSARERAIARAPVVTRRQADRINLCGPCTCTPVGPSSIIPRDPPAVEFVRACVITDAMDARRFPHVRHASSPKARPIQEIQHGPAHVAPISCQDHVLICLVPPRPPSKCRTGLNTSSICLLQAWVFLALYLVDMQD